jgi:hypothetical protein
MPRVLTSSVRVEDQAWRWAALEPRHLQSIRDQAALHVRLHASAHHLTTEQVNHSGQVQLALVGGNVGDVTRPDLVGGHRGEVALHQVRRNG